MDFLKPFQGDLLSVPPLWLMRQAGRCLPEYLKIRAQFPSFLDLVLTPEAAAEVTLQPVRRFDFDAAILFSDILIIPYALGQQVVFSPKPHLSPLSLEDPEFGLSLDQIESRLEPIYETVRQVRKNLSPQKALIGFAGSPFTVASYMLEGSGKKDFMETKRFAFRAPEAFQKLLHLISKTTLQYLKAQIDAGVQVVQLFESAGGCVPWTELESWVYGPTSWLVEELKKVSPHTPVIGFPRGLGASVETYVQKTRVNGVSLDTTIDLSTLLGVPAVIQGNLDPVVLLEGGPLLKNHVDRICQACSDRPFIFNLGHGVLPETPLSHIEELVFHVRNR
jgi:uroporphyrinogen decarboxylase